MAVLPCRWQKNKSRKRAISHFNKTVMNHAGYQLTAMAALSIVVKKNRYVPIFVPHFRYRKRNAAVGLMLEEWVCDFRPTDMTDD
ncbi:hypothetical protein CXF87_13400 [Halomonas sp. MES3-P3E]|nr:hypothetical protein CXF87_13400 [Halomonas sp. MES3-P3E]